MVIWKILTPSPKVLLYLKSVPTQKAPILNCWQRRLKLQITETLHLIREREGAQAAKERS